MAKNKIKGISESDQKKALEAGLLGADWFVNNQIDLAGKTCRDANGGRYINRCSVITSHNNSFLKSLHQQV